MKHEVIWGIHLEVTRDHLHVRAQSAPPPMSYRVKHGSATQSQMPEAIQIQGKKWVNVEIVM